MQWLTALLDMGGYGVFVWSAFGATIVVLVILVVVSLRSLRSNEAALTALEGGGRGNDREGQA